MTPRPSISPLPIILFDDGQGELSPLTDLRPAFDVRTGALTTLERVAAMCRGSPYQVAALFVPERLVDLTRERHSLPVNTVPAGVELAWFVNARWALPHAALFGQLAEGAALVEAGGGSVAAVCARADSAAAIASGQCAGKTTTELLRRSEGGLISRPWDVRAFRDACLATDLEMLAAAPTAAPGHITVLGGNALCIHPSARVYPTVVIDLEAGPVVIGEHAVIRPGAVLSGPCYVGPHSTVMDRAVIKANTAIGPHCKVGGEIGGTIFQGYSNKAHDGHLGDSWVGEWVNLGAGTTNSNLLNTYGEVICRARPDGPNEKTGQTFLGAVIGDHVKTAIGTRIMTGAIVGTGTMWAASAAVSGTVPAFTWATDAGVREGGFRFEKFMETAKAMMGRRKIEPSGTYIQLLQSPQQRS